MTCVNDYDITTQVLALCRFSGVQPRLFEALISHFGALEDILLASTDTLMGVKGMTPEAAAQIASTSEHLQKASGFYADLKGRNIEVKSRLDDEFPRRLFELNDPPVLLYVRGRTPDNTGKTVAIAGAENATNEGIELTVKLARRLASLGVQIIASLRRGIDAAAHLGAKAVAGASFSILDSGFDHICPAEHIPLAIDIAQTGGVISEYPPDQVNTDETFKRSNRILAALAQAVVTTELYRESTRTLDLLSCCNQIGKLTFLVIDPALGPLADEESLNMAVTNGAILMVGLDKVDDIVKALV
ncbi:MAG: DNA-processing protein DprA [Candidatus Zixiibacteriota bacterium]